MSGIAVGDVVVVHCREPREKVWGLLLQLDGVGVCVRGMDLGSVEDWLCQEASGGERLLGPSTFFLPLHRVQRVDLDGDRLYVSGATVVLADSTVILDSDSLQITLNDLQDGSNEMTITGLAWGFSDFVGMTANGWEFRRFNVYVANPLNQ